MEIIMDGSTNMCEMMDDIFKGADDVEQMRGYCTLVPLSGNHIKINGVCHFFPNKEKTFLSFNEYGQMSVEYKDGNKEDYPYERTTPTQLFISFDLKDLKEIIFTAPNKYGKINPKTGKKYYDLYIFRRK